MATTHTDLQALAAVEHDDAASAVSILVDLDPSTAPPTAGELASRLTAGIDTAHKARPADADHAHRAAFDAAIERLREWAAGDVDRPAARTRGLAVLTDAAGAFHVLWLPRPPGDEVHVGGRFAVLPLAAADARHSRLLVLLASREDGRALLVESGALVDVFDAGSGAQGRHDQGGWSQARYQRSIDRAARLHLAEAVERLERVFAQLGRPPVLVAANEENAAVVRAQMGQEIAAALAGGAGDLGDADAGAVLDLADECLHRLDCTREDELLERHSAQVGRGEADDGSADAALAAVSDGRAEWLLVSRRATVVVHGCRACGRLGAVQGACPIDGAPMRPDPDGLHTAAARTLLAGGGVWRLVDIDRPELDASDGIGVVTRF